MEHLSLGSGIPFPFQSPAEKLKASRCQKQLSSYYILIKTLLIDF